MLAAWTRAAAGGPAARGAGLDALLVVTTLVAVLRRGGAATLPVVAFFVVPLEARERKEIREC